eukprot:11081861-Prorocentrum_lima.AAC.1
MGMRVWTQILQLNDILPLQRARWVALVFPDQAYTRAQEARIGAFLARSWNTRPPPVVMQSTPPL